MNKMSKHNNPVQKYLISLQQSIPYLESKLKVQLSTEEILVWIATESGKEFNELYQAKFDKDILLHDLENSRLVKSKPKIIETIMFAESIIPLSTLKAVNEQQVKHKGEIWHIYKNDADPFPSNPHAHNYKTNLKLDLSNGDLYLGKEKVNMLKKKVLLALRQKIKYINLPEINIV